MKGKGEDPREMLQQGVGARVVVIAGGGGGGAVLGKTLRKSP